MGRLIRDGLPSPGEFLVVVMFGFVGIGVWSTVID